ncbi:MAG: type II toxin-antitoxin system YafQ family toxin [Synergistaceae bacterium]|nr:type II toxin-antitoxin system YafQ family toxin [Synergistaceae bacterium]MBR0279515.1 type II toxin-antitoxin system YafQ family toxin [Synergistaceae bacterium]
MKKTKRIRIYSVRTSKRYRRELKTVLSRGKDESKLEEVIDILASGESLPPRYADHPLSGKWKGYRECHIEPNWLLVYSIHDDVLVLALMSTGTHSDIFGM